MTVTNLATGGLTGAANYVVKNVFGSDQKKSSVSFLAQLASMIGKKKQIQQKYEDFDEMMVKLFDTFDKFYPMIGKSLLISSMLDRYKDQLVERFEMKQFENVNIMVNQVITDTMLKDMENFMSDDEAIIPKSLTDLFNYKKNRRNKLYGFKELQNMLLRLQNRLDQVNMQVQSMDEHLNALQKESSSLSFLQLHRKNEIKEEVEKLNKKKAGWMKKQEDGRLNIRKVEKIKQTAEPLLVEIETFKNHLNSVIDKYSLSVDQITF